MNSKSKPYKNGYAAGTWHDPHKKQDPPAEYSDREKQQWLTGFHHAIEDRLS